MNSCSYYKEESSYFQSTDSDSLEIEMNLICTRPGIEALGVHIDITPCGGTPKNCPFEIYKKGYFQY